MRSSRRLAVAVVLASAFAACATEEPVETYLAPADEVIQVEILGDGFVRTGDRRIPREAFVLELRQRVRPMPSEKIALLRVEIDVREDADERATRDSDWLLDQLYVMGIGQVRYL